MKVKNKMNNWIYTMINRINKKFIKVMEKIIKTIK